MDLWPSHVYRAEGLKLGRSTEVLSEALAQARSTQSRGFPAILTLMHLAVHTHVAYERLRLYVERGRLRTYREFKIRKRSGGLRLICVPEPALMRVQRWLTTNVLNHAEPHHCSTAYAPGASIAKTASRHCGARWLLKIDIRNFFESISEIQAYRVFRRIGYNSLIAFEMARICTRIDANKKRSRSAVWLSRGRIQSIPAYMNRQIGHLAQGAPTSPMLANLAMEEVDTSIAAIASQRGFEYTRYADDLTFSSSDPDARRSSVLQMLSEARNELALSGLTLNRRKTMISPPGARKIVLGLLVNGPKPRLRREFKSSLQTHAHFITKYGPAPHATNRGFHSVWSMYRHVTGLISFARLIEPEFAAKIERSIEDRDWSVFAPILT